MLRRRAWLLVLAVALVAGACGGDDDDAASTTSTTGPTTTSTSRPTTVVTADPAVESLRTSADCGGVGEVTGDHDVTFVRDGRIWTDDGRCIAEYAGPARLAWSGNADRLLAGRRSVLLDGGPSDVVPAGMEALGWSAPTGRAIVARDDEQRLSKLALDGAPVLELSNVAPGSGEVLYHPSGTAIAVVEDANANVVLFSNRGEDPQWLLGSEIVDEVADIAFSADGDLVFVARHGVEHHLHRLTLGEETVSDVLVTDEPIANVTPSPWYDTAIAAARGTCADPGELFVQVDGEARDLSGSEVARGRPVGWTPTTALVVLVPDGCGADGEPTGGDLYVVHTSDVERVAEDVEAAAVRAVAPPPPPPPPDIPPVPA